MERERESLCYRDNSKIPEEHNGSFFGCACV